MGVWKWHENLRIEVNFTMILHNRFTLRKEQEQNLQTWIITMKKKQKKTKKVCCHDCRSFDNGGCSEYIGKYHKTCEDFE